MLKCRRTLELLYLSGNFVSLQKIQRMQNAHTVAHTKNTFFYKYFMQCNFNVNHSVGGKDTLNKGEKDNLKTKTKIKCRR